jgi:hypothetical protein
MSDSILPEDGMNALIVFEGAGIVLQRGWTISRPTRRERIIELREELAKLESSSVEESHRSGESQIRPDESESIRQCRS